MNMISTGTFQTEMDASNKQPTLAEKFAAVWEKKNAKAARAGGVSLMALSLAACGSDDSTTATTTTDTTTTTTTVDATKSFAATIGLDTFVGGSGADSFSASNTTLNAGDSMTGGAGADLLGIFSSAIATVGGFTAAGIETISGSSTSSTAADILTINMGGVSGETAVRVTGSSSSVTFTNSDNIVPLELMYNSAGNVVVTLNASTVVGTADEYSISTTDTTNGTVNVAGVETITVTNSGTSSIATLTAANATTLNLAGSGSLTVTDLNDTLTTVSATGSTGTNILDGFGATDATVTGGAGADTFKMGETLTKADTVDGGAGADTLVVNNTGGGALTIMPVSASVSNVETLRIEATDDSGADAFSLDGSVASFDNIIIDASDENDTYTFTKITDENISITESANNAVALVNVSMTDATGSADALTLTVTNADAATALTVTDINSTGGGIETLNLVLNQGVDISAASDIIIADVSSTHSGGVVVTGAADFTIGSGTAFANKSLDASAATGDVTATIGAAVSTIKTGSGADSITFAANALTSADTIDAGAGADTLVMGAVAGGNHNPTITGAETITIDVENASTQLNMSKTTGATSLTVLAVSDEAPVFNNVPAELATFRVQNKTGAEAATFNYATGSNAAHTINLGDSTAASTSDVDLGIVTVTGNTGALTVNSDSVAGNSIYALTANIATSLTINTTKDLELDTTTGTGILGAAKATSVDINVSGGALVIDGAQTLSVATTIDIDADKNTTLTGAMDGAKATSLVVHADAGAAMEQTGNFTSDADITVSLTADGASSSIRYNGILDVDHVTTIDLVAKDGGSITIDDIEMLGVNSATTAVDVTSALNMTATGANGTTGSNITITAINTAAAATLDTVTMVGDSTSTINFTTGAANLTITTLDASAALGTNVFDTSTSGAAVTFSLGAATKNTVTTELDQTDVVTLSTSASSDVIKVMDDTTAADTVSNFKGGAGGDLVQIDTSALLGGAVQTFNTLALDTLQTRIATDDDGVLANADNTILATDNMLKLTDTFANLAAMHGAIDLDAETNGGGLLNDEAILVLWTDGSDTHLSTVTLNGADGAAADASADLLVFTACDITTLTNDNFVFI
jgi:hypothetical protein